MSANSLVVKQWFKRPWIVVGILAVGLILTSFVVTLPRAGTQPAAVVTENRDGVQRGIDATAARLTALGAFYGARDDGVQRGIDATAARLTALGAFYGARDDGVQRGIDASAARLTAMAEYYAAARK